MFHWSDADFAVDRSMLIPQQDALPGDDLSNLICSYEKPLADESMPMTGLLVVLLLSVLCWVPIIVGLALTFGWLQR